MSTPPPNAIDNARRKVHLGAIVTTALVSAQAVLAVLIIVGVTGVMPIHGYIGYAAVISAIATAVFAALWAKQAGERGKMFHAIAIPVLMIIQIGLAEAEVKGVHIILGFAILLAVFALVPMTAAKPTPKPSGPSASS